MPKFQPVKIATAELAALAFAAQRANGTLHKDVRAFNKETEELITVVPNKTLMRETVRGAENGLTVTEEDRTNAQDAVLALQQDNMLTLLRGRQVNTFVQSLIDALSKEESTEQDCGLIAFLPNIYNQLKARQQKDESVNELSYTSKALGNVGTKITVDVTVIQSRYLSAYNCWSVFGHDGKGNCVGFLTGKESCTVSGKYTGKIKRVGNDQYHSNAVVTSLNFVKKCNT